MNEISQDVMGVGTVDLDILDGCHVPRVGIVAFCETEAVADKVAAIINEQPETRTALESIREGNAFIFITLKKDRERGDQIRAIAETLGVSRPRVSQIRASLNDLADYLGRPTTSDRLAGSASTV